MTQMTLNTSLTAYTLEFWVRPTSNYYGSAYLMGLYSTNIWSRHLYTYVVLNPANSLSCYPSEMMSTNL